MNRKQSILAGALIATIGVLVATTIVAVVVVRQRFAASQAAAEAKDRSDARERAVQREQAEAARLKAAAAASAAVAKRIESLRAMTPEQRRAIAAQAGYTGDATKARDVVAAATGPVEAELLSRTIKLNLVAANCEKAVDGDDNASVTNMAAVALSEVGIRDIRGLAKTTVGEARKDSRLNRGKWIEASGQVVQIHRDGSVYRGLMLTDGLKAISFATSGPTAGIVEDSRATFVGLFQQQYNFPNIAGGETQSLLLVGHFKGQGLD